MACRFNGEVGDVVVGRITEVRPSFSICDTFLIMIDSIYVFLYNFRCSRNDGRWRQTPDWILSSCCLLSTCLEESWWDHWLVILEEVESCQKPGFISDLKCGLSLLEAKISRRWAHHERVPSRGRSHQCNSVILYLGCLSFHLQLRFPTTVFFYF